MREDHGFRLMDYSVDSDSASPRACFQFSEPLPGRRVDLSPFVSVTGLDKPAISVDEQQLVRRRAQARRTLCHDLCGPACRRR